MAILLSGIWLLLSGHYDALLLSLGAASVGLVLLLAQRMAVIDQETQPLHLGSRLVAYWLWLALQIARSNVAVAARILAPRPAISPTMVQIPVHEKTELGQTIFANSITLTPGTVSVSLRGGVVEVHGLARADTLSLANGEMQRRVRTMEQATETGT